MRASLVRTASVPGQKAALPASPKLSLPRQACFSGDKIAVHLPRVSLHLHSNRPRSIHRALSESEVTRSESQNFGIYRKLNGTGTRSFPASIPHEAYHSDSEFHGASDRNQLRKPNYAGVRPGCEIPSENLGFGGGVGGGGGDHRIATITGGNDGDKIKIGVYYEEMLKSNPTDALLLGNYSKFLYEVKKDMVRAEEYYGRAILANPGDGEMLSLYGKLVWETQGDEERAKSYFDQAVHAAPDDCMVLGSYAHFIWEAEDNQEEEENGKAEALAAELIAAF